MHSADPRVLQRQPGNQRTGALPSGGNLRNWMQAGRYPRAIACSACHDLIDGRKRTTDYTRDELRLMHAEGVLRTLAIWKQEGLLKA